MISFSEIYVLDRNSEYLGIPQRELMENAGKGLADALVKNFNLKGKNVLILCGTGNNGGDGFVAARYLKEHCKVKVVLARPKKEIGSNLAYENLERLVSGGVEISGAPANPERELEKADIIIDAMLGVGIRKEVKEPYSSLIKRLNRLNKTVVSVDVPSGFSSSISVRPKMTVTFHDVKEGMNPKNSGRIIVADIGIPNDAELYVGPGEFVYYPVPKEDSHKGDNGRVLVVGGGPYTGAPSLAALAAYRTGADLVRLAVPKTCYNVVASYTPNFLMHPLDGDVIDQTHLKNLANLTEKVDSVLVGPGAGEHRKTLGAMTAFIKMCKKPLVIDADGIKSVAKNINILKGRNGIITPHKGEFELLLGSKLSDDVEVQKKKVSEFAEKIGFTVILKGHIDVISDGIQTKLNRIGNPGMTVGGTGDVLSGICAALLSKKMGTFNAARLATFINGYAGDLAFQRKSYGLLSTDVIEDISNVLNRFIR